MRIIFKIRKKLGNLKRGVAGFFINKTDRIKFPDNKVKKYGIGETVNGEKIYYYETGEGKINVLFLSAIHGNEVGTVKLAFNLIDWADKENSGLSERYKFYIIPVLNVDGYLNALRKPDYFDDGREGRFNANNIDLNRNFYTPGFKKKSIYSFGKNYSEKEEVYCGEYGNSEPEIKCLVEFIKNNKISVIFSFHNKGKEVMGNNLAVSAELAKIYAEKSGFKFAEDKEWIKLNQTGTLKEWTELNNIIYIEPEGTTRWGSDWSKQKNAIIACLKSYK